MSWLTPLTISEKVALVGVAIIWVVYRIGQWNERRGVIRGLENELEMHGNWVGIPRGPRKRGPFTDPGYMVFKLATVAVDNAIARGPSLFLNRDLTPGLVRYRQVVSHLNQLIEMTINPQANAELWSTTPPPAALVQKAIQYVEAVHIDGIGDMASHPPAAHAFFRGVMDELDRERDSKVLPISGAATSLNFFFL